MYYLTTVLLGILNQFFFDDFERMFWLLFPLLVRYWGEAGSAAGSAAQWGG